MMKGELISAGRHDDERAAHGPGGRVRVGVLISGRGSNMAALIEAAKDPGYPAAIVLVLSNNPAAKGLEAARRCGVFARAIDHRSFRGDRGAHERLLHAALLEADVELVALAGYMRVLTPRFVTAWSGRMINIHPSLLPAFPGLDTHARALAAGVEVHGCTVHWVTEGVDAGPQLGQAQTAVLPHDDAESLAERVLLAEHRLYPTCLAQAARQLRTASGSQSISVQPVWK